MYDHMKLPSVVILGRSNVGKSSLFNKITEQNRALVLPEAGTTRDRLEAQVFWRKKTFNIIDTGGLDPDKDDIYHDPIISQALHARKGASIILLMVDVLTGVLDEDIKIVKDLRKIDKPILLVINKCDNPKRRAKADEFKKLDLDMNLISATNGSGTGDLLDVIVNLLPENKKEKDESEITLALVGKPNVGKSSILNSMYGEERMIVSPVPHTTRDSQDVDVNYKDTNYTIIDTAGIRRRTKQGDEVENLSIAKSKAAINRSDVVALIMDISEKATSQDKRLAREVQDCNKGLFIVANKWDKIPEKDDKTIDKYKTYIERTFPNLSWVPIVFTSAIENKRTKEILSLAKDIHTNLAREITENALSKFLKLAATKRKPTIGKGTRRPRLLILKQLRNNPPSFLIEIPNKTSLAKSYQQYLLNSLRDKFDFEGVPIKLRVKERELKKVETDNMPEQKKKKGHRHRRTPQTNMRRR